MLMSDKSPSAQIFVGDRNGLCVVIVAIGGPRICNKLIVKVGGDFVKFLPRLGASLS